MSRTAEEIREANRIANKAYRDRKKIEKAQIANDVMTSDVASSNNDPSLSVDVVMTETPRKSLRERFFGMDTVKSSSSSRSSSSRSSSSRAKQPNLLMTVFPIVIGTFVATFLRDLIPDPYKPCAPSQDEASKILGPICAIIARRIQISGKANQDAIDLGNALVAGFICGTRSYVTYVQIKENERQEKASGGHGTRESVPQPDVRANGSDVRSDANGVNADPVGQSGDKPDGMSEADLFADLFARDKQGRIRMGLLPSTV